MKKIVFVFLLLISFQFISAAEIAMKDNFSQGETLIAKVSGNFYQPINKDDVEFYAGHVRTSIIPNLQQINSDFYIYAQLAGKSPDNYSILIKNAKYYQNGQLIENSLTKNFSITNASSDFSINPAALIASSNFSIEATNLRDWEIKVIAVLNSNESGNGFFQSFFGSSNEENNTYTITAAKKQKINFDIGKFNKTGVNFIKLSSDNATYQVPVYISSIPQSNKEVVFRIDPPILNITMPTNSNTTRTLYINNSGATIENVTFSISDSLKPYVSVSRNATDEIKGNSSFRIDLVITSPSAEKSIEGQMTVKSGDKYSYGAIFLTFLKDYIPANGENATVIQRCSEINGIICGENTKCSVDVNYASDGPCCLGTCNEVKSSSVGKYIGWGILILIVGVIVWFYLRRYRKVESVADLTKFIKK